jgi:hypothetical protein
MQQESNIIHRHLNIIYPKSKARHLIIKFPLLSTCYNPSYHTRDLGLSQQCDLQDKYFGMFRLVDW